MSNLCNLRVNLLEISLKVKVQVINAPDSLK